MTFNFGKELNTFNKGLTYVINIVFDWLFVIFFNKGKFQTSKLPTETNG